MNMKSGVSFKLLWTAFIVAVFSAICSLSAYAEAPYIKMQYDDYFSDFEYTDVTVLDKGTATSYKVGYGVKSGTRDDSVVEVTDGVLHASGVGTARVKIDGTEYRVSVEPAPISMFFLIGQSNMYGNDGDASQSVANKNGTAYSTLGVYEELTVDNAIQFVPSALSGKYSKINMQGNTTKLENNAVNRLTVAGDGKTGLDSGFAYKWHEMTGDKVWLVNAAHGGTPITKWKKGGTEYNQAVAVFKYAQQVMKNEIAAGHYVLRTYGSLWCQGCSDRPYTAQHYIDNFLSMYNGMKKDLEFDINNDGTADKLNFFDIIMPRAGKDDCVGYRSGIYDDTTTKKYERTFKDLEMRGHRVAQYWLVNNPSYKDINLICNLGDSWVYMPDGSNNVKSYFTSKYSGGKVDYPVQVEQSASWYYPSKPEDVHDNIHYNQVGYNEIGFEAAKNAAYTHGRSQKPENVETRVTFYDWTGYRQVNSIAATTWKDSHSLVVPVVYPVYESKNVTYSVSANLTYDLYDLTSKHGSTGGELVAVGSAAETKVTVLGEAAFNIGENYYYYKGTAVGLEQVKDVSNPENRVVPQATADGLGTVKNSVHSNFVYRFDRTINLLSNHEWVIEWSGRSTADSKTDISHVILGENVYLNKSSSGDVNYILQKYTANGSDSNITVGRVKKGTSTYEQAATVVDSLVSNMKTNHTYRLYNRIEKDGSNSIHLSVDGIYCGQYSGVSSRNFAFRFIGADSYELNSYVVNYLEIYENSHASVTGHSVTKKETSPKCTKSGLSEIVCSECNYVKREIISATDHDCTYKSVAATCTNAGYKEYKCKNCSYVKMEIIPVKDHNFKYKSAAATCTKDGYKGYVCSCGKKVGYSVISKTGHSYSAYSSDKNATYLADGTKTAKCKKCSVKKTVTDKGSKLILKPPSKVTATPAKTSVSLSWPKSKNAVGYRVYMKVNGSWKELKTTTATSYKATGLTAGTTYDFAVKAYTKSGSKTVWSTTYTKVRTMTRLATPEISVSSTAKGKATVTIKDVKGETGYQLWYSTSKNGTYKKLTNIAANTKKTTQSGLKASKVYYFKLRAYTKTADGYVYSSYSSVKSVKIKK